MPKTKAWTRKEGQNPKGGLNKKGRDSYTEGDNPRRAGFLARMGNMPGPEYEVTDKGKRKTRLLLSLNAWGASSKSEAKRIAKGISRRNKNKGKA